MDAEEVTIDAAFLTDLKDRRRTVSACRLWQLATTNAARDALLAAGVPLEDHVLHACDDMDTPHIEALVALGADVNARTDWGSTPLHFATEVHAAAALLRLGADVHAVTSGGTTPLHWAESVEVALLLIRAGADLNAGDTWGQTPMMRWRFPWTDELWEACIAAGADWTQRDRRGCTLHCHLDSVADAARLDALVGAQACPSRATAGSKDRVTGASLLRLATP